MNRHAVLADAVMLVHFAFLVFLVFGGFLAWRWPRLIWVHVLAAAWGFSTVAFSLPCPLTDVEDWARERAGEATLSGSGFIDHYIEGVLYPDRYTALLQGLVGVAVVASWCGFIARRAT
ncbi:DUF2784 domain-containing protein [Knoellia sp. S7-12]|uniref:DUF2784 domain-containing protein n=1 Tax=Knoellia sp. S7-12 TaxID=3126698 RepID=UPI0033682825